MTFAEYIPLAMRTQRKDLTDDQKLLHGVCGLVSELSEFYDAYGFKNILLEAGDIYWMLAELASVLKINPAMIEERINKPAKLSFVENNAAWICNAIQKHLQGKEIDEEEISERIGNIIIDTACILLERSKDITLYRQMVNLIMEQNIEKLKKRYPDGFDADRSINRNECL